MPDAIRPLAAALLLLTVCLAVPAAHAQPPTLELDPLADGLDFVVAIDHAGDERLYLAAQNGLVVVYEDGSLNPTPFLDIRDRVLFPPGISEQGLTGFAFHPDFEENGYFFVTYVTADGNASVVARYQATGSPPLADPSSERILMQVGQPNRFHNAGQLSFGPDGYLYVGFGDGGAGEPPLCTSQEPGTLLGKILRVDVDQNVDTAPYYAVPDDNPFLGQPVRNEAWAIGLRNPWRFSFDPATGDLFIADVGQTEREELNVQPAASTGGENYGWKVMEGTLCRGDTQGCNVTPPPCFDPAYTMPVIEYDPDAAPDRCAIIGGHVYRGTDVPNLAGAYVYGDFCGQLWLARADGGGGWRAQPVEPQLTNVTTFGVDAGGELYLSADGALYRVTGLETPGSVAFAANGFGGDEEAGTLELTLERRDGDLGELAVRVRTATDDDGARPAAAGADYAAVDAVVTWADGDMADKTVAVPLLSDAEAEGTETFRVVLSEVTGGGLAGPAAALAWIRDDEQPPAPCTEAPGRACVRDDRFAVDVRFVDPAAGEGPAVATGLTGDSAYFTFFDEENPEVFVKVLDACAPPFHHYWVFTAGLTNLDVTVTVTDTDTGVARAYRNEPGTLYLPEQDTAAFPTCP